MPQETNVFGLNKRREQQSTRLNNDTRFDLHMANPELLSPDVVRAKREALGAAAFTKTPLEKEKRLAELAVEGIVRHTAWIDYARRDYLDRHWNLEDKNAA